MTPRTPTTPTTAESTVRWLLHVARPTLPPLAWSALCRIVDQLLGCALLALGGYWVADVALGAAGDAGTAPAGAAPGALPGPAWAVPAAMAAISLVKALLHYGEQYLGHKVAFTALELLRAMVFRGLIPRSPAAMEDAAGPGAVGGTGDALARVTGDIDRIEVFFAHTIAPAVSAVAVPAILVTVIGSAASWPMAAAAAAVFTVTLPALLAVGHRSAKAAAAVELHSAGATAQEISDTMRGLTEVVGYGAGADRMGRLAASRAAGSAARRSLARTLAVRRFIGQAGMLACVALPLAAAWPGVTAGTVSVPAAIGAALALWRSWDVVRGVEDFATALQTSLGAAGRVHALVHGEPAVADGPGTADPRRGPAVTWRRVGFSRPGALRPALDGVSATAPAGAWTAVLGTTGSGKSTLLSMLLRHHDPDSGAVLLDGCDVRGWTVDSLRAPMAVVAQDDRLFAGSVADNLLLMAPGAGEDDMWAALADARLDGEVRAMGGLGADVGESGSRLSGGQRQRLALARALLRRPAVLVLDEFTAHLDPPLADAVRRAARTRLPEATIIEVTHTADHLRGLVDHVIVLDAGRVAAEGDPTGLLDDPDSPLRRVIGA